MMKKVMIVIMEKVNFSKLVPQAQTLICKLIAGGSYKWWQPETEDESLLL